MDSGIESSSSESCSSNSILEEDEITKSSLATFCPFSSQLYDPIVSTNDSHAEIQHFSVNPNGFLLSNTTDLAPLHNFRLNLGMRSSCVPFPAASFVHPMPITLRHLAAVAIAGTTSDVSAMINAPIGDSVETLECSADENGNPLGIHWGSNEKINPSPSASSCCNHPFVLPLPFPHPRQSTYMACSSSLTPEQCAKFSEMRRKLRTQWIRIRRHQLSGIPMWAKERKLRIAVSLNNSEMVQRLLSDNVNPNSVDERQRSPLHIAASKGYTDIVRILLQHGADPNQKDAIGNTPLHLAACTSHIPTVTLLLKSGTNLKEVDNQGYSPVQLARSKLKLLQSMKGFSCEEVQTQVQQIIEMMQTFLETAGNRDEADLLSSFSSKLSFGAEKSEGVGEEDLQMLLNSLNDLSLAKPKLE